MTTLIVACVLASAAAFIVGRFVGTKIAQRDMPSRKRYIKLHRLFWFIRRPIPASDIELRAGHDVAVAVLAAFVVLGLALPSLGFWLPVLVKGRESYIPGVTVTSFLSYVVAVFLAAYEIHRRDP